MATLEEQLLRRRQLVERLQALESRNVELRRAMREGQRQAEEAERLRRSASLRRLSSSSKLLGDTRRSTSASSPGSRVTSARSASGGDSNNTTTTTNTTSSSSTTTSSTAAAGKGDDDEEDDTTSSDESDDDDGGPRSLAAVLRACGFMTHTNANLRAAMASLLRQQELVVHFLRVLSEEDKVTVMKVVTERFAAAQLEEQEAKKKHGAAKARSMQQRECCPVDATKLQEEWARIFGFAPETEDIAPAAGELEGETERERGINVIVQSLESNRSLYSEAIVKGDSIGTDPDAFQNYGFSMEQMPGYEYEYDEEDSPDNIVEQMRGVGADQALQIKCATLTKLIERMTLEDKQDLNVRYTFLLTYRSFTTPKELLQKLASRYYVPIPPNMTPDEIKLFVRLKLAPIQIKVFGVLKKWVEEHYEDFYDDEELTLQLKELIDGMITRSMGAWSKKSARALLSMLERREMGEVRNLELDTDNFPRPELPVGLTLANFNLLDIKPIEIARQLCILDFNSFKQIRPREFLGQSWTKKKKKRLAPNVVNMIQRFNEVSCWVQKTILDCDQLETRVQLLVKFIKVAKHCRALHNFHSLYAIYSALYANAIHRLRQTWALVPSRQLERFDSFKQLFSHDKNSLAFRRALQEAIPPCIPHIGLFLADLVFIEDGNPDEFNGMINFQKRRMLAERIMWIKQYQQVGYKLETVTVIQDYFTKELTMLDQDTLYEMSLQVEPRRKPGQQAV